MTKTKSIYLALVAVLLSPMANAGPITFEMDFSGTAGSPDGFFQIDDSKILPSARVYFSAFDAFELILDTFTVSFSAGHAFESDAGVLFDAAGDFLAFFDDSDGSPQFFEFFPTQLILNFPSLGDYQVVDGTFTALESGTFTVSRVSSIPEPGTLALLGLGLAGMGMTRRKKKV